MNSHPLTRRAFGGLAAAGAAALAAPAYLRAQDRPRVVVIGGGAGGATAARYIARDSQGAVDVTLVEANPRYVTCFFSNLYLGGFWPWEDLVHGYGRLADHGVTVVTAVAEDVDRAAAEVVLQDGRRLPYDRLVMSPGIDLIWDSVPGYSPQAAEIMPHAYKPGAQTRLLKIKLDTLRDGQDVVMVAPPNPYRCPPGPYERVSMMAHVLKAKGHTRSRIIVLDAKPSFSKQALFTEGWERHYPGMIEWYGPDVHGGVEGVDPAAGVVMTGLDDFQGGLVNVIPRQKAGEIAQRAGLANESGFCAIDPFTMRSVVDENVYVLGDATIAGDMPKSGFSANSQAKVAAMVIRSELTDSRAFPARYANTCWSLIQTDDGVKIGAAYEPTAEKIAATSSFVSQTGEDPALRKATFEESIGWYNGIMADMLG